jgi:hypothetical protein
LTKPFRYGKINYQAKGYNWMKKLFKAFTFILVSILLVTSASAAPRDEAEPGIGYNIIYYEEFNYDNNGNTSPILQQLGWTALSFSTKTAVTEPTAKLSIIDGKLYIENNKSGGVDSYFMILNDAKMFGAWQGDYTVQFDVTLTSAGDNSRYIALLTDYKPSTKGDYHSFHLRINGSANNQARIAGKWTTFDYPGAYYAADQDDTDGTSTIAKKVLGKDYNGSQVLKNKTLTIRIVCEKYDIGPRVYIRNTGEGGDFVLVSRAGSMGEGYTSAHWRKTGGKSIVLKAGGTINGYVDNILVYTGTGEPVFEELKVPETTAEPETTATPETTAAPETEPMTEAAPAPEESGCTSFVALSIIPLLAAAFVILKKK